MTLIPIRGNALGLAMIVVTGAIAGIGSLALKLSDVVVMAAVGAALIAMDLLVRWRARPTPRWLTERQYGGYLFFVPIWGVGVIVIVVNLINTFT